MNIKFIKPDLLVIDNKYDKLLVTVNNNYDGYEYSTKNHTVCLYTKDSLYIDVLLWNWDYIRSFPNTIYQFLKFINIDDCFDDIMFICNRYIRSKDNNRRYVLLNGLNVYPYANLRTIIYLFIHFAYGPVYDDVIYRRFLDVRIDKLNYNHILVYNSEFYAIYNIKLNQIVMMIDDRSKCIFYTYDLISKTPSILRNYLTDLYIGNNVDTYNLLKTLIYDFKDDTYSSSRYNFYKRECIINNTDIGDNEFDLKADTSFWYRYENYIKYFTIIKNRK